MDLPGRRPVDRAHRLDERRRGLLSGVHSPNRFVWDGQVLLAVLDHTNGVVVSFLRGLDLSGSEQGAGGVGGLLAVGCPTNGTHFVAYDGNGNVSALVSASDGTVSAEYAYGPFGEPVRATGTMAKTNPIRFSTQYADDLCGDLKYLFRDYNPSTGRWLSFDPIGEEGGMNLYGFILNSPINLFDLFGLRDITPEEEKTLGELASLAKNLRAKKKQIASERDLVAAIDAVIADVRKLIASVKDKNDPARLKIGLKALNLWGDKNTALSYEPKYFGGNATCNFFVADVLRSVGYETKLVGRATRLYLTKRVPNAGEWHEDRTLGAFKITWKIRSIDWKGNGKSRNEVLRVNLTQPVNGAANGVWVNIGGAIGSGTAPPVFGEIISYPHHVGIYIGDGFRSSSGTGHCWKNILRNWPNSFIKKMEKFSVKQWQRLKKCRIDQKLKRWKLNL